MAFDIDTENEYINEEDVKIVVIGVGGGGGNTIATMVERKVAGVHYVVANTNTRDLDNKDKSKITTIHLAKKPVENNGRDDRRMAKRRSKVVRGAGGDPRVGEECANDTIDKIIDEIEDADMVFIAASMGGGTGTGAAPVVAKAAMEMGILTVGVTTKPFRYEGAYRMKVAIDGIQKMRENVDALIVIDDEAVFSLNENINMAEVFKAVDDVLCKAVIGIIDLIDADGFINVDFADVCATLEKAGLAHMAIGHGRGENARQNAVNEVLHSPLLETSIDGAKRGLINISIPKSFPINEYQQLASEIADRFNSEAFFKVGVVFDEDLGDDEINIIAIATDFDEEVQARVIEKDPTSEESRMNYLFDQQRFEAAAPSVSQGTARQFSQKNDDPNRANAIMDMMNAINGSKGR